MTRFEVIAGNKKSIINHKATCNPRDYSWEHESNVSESFKSNSSGVESRHQRLETIELSVAKTELLILSWQWRWKLDSLSPLTVFQLIYGWQLVPSAINSSSWKNLSRTLITKTKNFENIFAAGLIPIHHLSLLTSDICFLRTTTISYLIGMFIVTN